MLEKWISYVGLDARVEIGAILTAATPFRAFFLTVVTSDDFIFASS